MTWNQFCLIPNIYNMYYSLHVLYPTHCLYMWIYGMQIKYQYQYQDVLTTLTQGTQQCNISISALVTPLSANHYSLSEGQVNILQHSV
jgi:hypothetical protein